MAKHRKPTQTCRQLTPRQALFAKGLASGATITQAARNAGYSGKNLAQSGHQAVAALRLKMPELMDEVGLTARMLIEKHLVPLLAAKETKYFVVDRKLVSRQVEALRIRLDALDMAFRLRGSFAPKDPKEAAHFGVKVIVVDVARPSVALPDYPPGATIDLTPYKNGASGNGHKPQE